MKRRMGWSAGAAVIVLAVSGCGVLGGGGGETGSLESMLGQVPDNAGNRTSLIYGSLARLRGDAPPAKDDEADLKALMKKSNGTFVIAEPAQNYILAGFSKEAGFGLRDIDYSVQAGQPPNVLSVFGGRFDTGKVDTTLTKNASFAKETKTGEHAGVKTYSVGKNGTLDMRAQSALRPVGNALRIGVTGEQIWLTSKDQLLNGALDVADGDGTSLADDDRYVEVAKAVDEAKAFNAIVLGDPRSLTADAAGMLGDRATPEQAAALQKQIDAGKLGLAPWQVAAVADAPGELVIALSHADEAAAKDNEKRLRTVIEQGTSLLDARRWSERFSITSMQVDGDLLVAHLKAERPMALRLIQAKDNLILIAKK
ncbi:hypothetical protein [Flindersiella endophytica]